MKERSGWLSMILPPPSDNILSGADLDKGYKNFSRGLRVILTILVLVPLTFISILSYDQVRELLQNEELDQLVLHLEQTTNAIEKFVSELQSVVKFVAPDDRYQELIDPKKLESLFVRLQSEYPGFADIEVIDSQGMQKSYFGPYQLEEHNYSDQTWYKEVLFHGVYISSVFSGFRHVPHFVIAVSRKLPRGKGSWVLRVTIDGKTLQNFVDTISTTYADDIFLVDSDRFAQTKPKKYGKIGEKCLLLGLTDKTDKRFKERIAARYSSMHKAAAMRIVQKTINGQQIIHAVVNLSNTPWKLVLVKEQYLYADSWREFKVRLTTIFLTCAITAIFLILGISNAITDHLRKSDKKREQFLVEAEQPNKLASIGRLAAGVAHEINNPLAVINQKTGLVQDFMEMSEDFAHKKLMMETLGGIQGSVERCKKITHRLLGFARQAEVKTEEIDINVIVREVVDFLAKEASYNQIEIDFDLDEQVSTIVSDRGQLQQILINITNNAIDAIGSNGQVTLSSRQLDQDNIQIRITDDGPGIPPEVQQRIFDPFFTTKETGKGTGLGLSIVYGILKKLGGNINVISEVGIGTAFEITLPVKQSEQE
ncbi:MAG: ATP-binding protein [Thermodesulfobacteriota bacterium]|nr:ATP-binding protein [Thermodesulfobacteriota bacterium]